MVLLQQAVRLRPKAKEAINNLGLAYADLGRFDQAERCYRDALRLDPGYADAHANLGNTYKEQGRTNEALACYQLALALEPRSASSRYNRALAWLQAGDYQPRVAGIRMALETQVPAAAADAEADVGWVLVGRQDHLPLVRTRAGRCHYVCPVRRPGQATRRHRHSGMSGGVASLTHWHVTGPDQVVPEGQAVAGFRRALPAPEPAWLTGYDPGQRACPDSLSPGSARTGRALGSATSRPTLPSALAWCGRATRAWPGTTFARFR